MQLLPVSGVPSVVVRPSVSCPSAKIVLSVFLAFSELALLDFEVNLGSQHCLSETFWIVDGQTGRTSVGVILKITWNCLTVLLNRSLKF